MIVYILMGCILFTLILDYFVLFVLTVKLTEKITFVISYKEPRSPLYILLSYTLYILYTESAYICIYY